MSRTEPAGAPRPLARGALPADTVALARFLIGKTLVRATAAGIRAVRIVETEAYVADDPASHAYRGQTRRNAAMFLRRGHAYVYIAYGCWPVLNVSSEAEGIGTAVLLRAGEPLAEADGNGAPGPKAASGPGRLARHLGITLAEDGADLCSGGPLHLAAATRPAGPIAVGPRIGITKAAERPLRFFELGNAAVSGPARGNRKPGPP
ncbi:DNA-3-methyladenine glycosylase [Propylenella binzhouense]|uniref:Putative 3-methyladenine DNA glycosylase n=1 Tax=Propylenella binzhouense TaxID=2555902 RepID=A0A964WUI6_9HYPH|nr:DNA-3-methyladenine glycosylase [Propylenella binzhouense]